MPELAGVSGAAATNTVGDDDAGAHPSPEVDVDLFGRPLPGAPSGLGQSCHADRVVHEQRSAPVGGHDLLHGAEQVLAERGSRPGPLPHRHGQPDTDPRDVGHVHPVVVGPVLEGPAQLIQRLAPSVEGQRGQHRGEHLALAVQDDAAGAAAGDIEADGAGDALGQAQLLNGSPPTLATGAIGHDADRPVLTQLGQGPPQDGARDVQAGAQLAARGRTGGEDLDDPFLQAGGGQGGQVVHIVSSSRLGTSWAVMEARNRTGRRGPLGGVSPGGPDAGGRGPPGDLVGQGVSR